MRMMSMMRNDQEDDEYDDDDEYDYDDGEPRKRLRRGPLGGEPVGALRTCTKSIVIITINKKKGGHGGFSGLFLRVQAAQRGI